MRLLGFFSHVHYFWFPAGFPSDFACGNLAGKVSNFDHGLLRWLELWWLVVTITLSVQLQVCILTEQVVLKQGPPAFVYDSSLNECSFFFLFSFLLLWVAILAPFFCLLFKILNQRNNSVILLYANSLRHGLQKSQDLQCPIAVGFPPETSKQCCQIRFFEMLKVKTHLILD